MPAHRCPKIAPKIARFRCGTAAHAEQIFAFEMIVRFF